MGKKKSKGEYNDFLDGEKLRDNTEIRTTLQSFAERDISPPPTGQDRRGSNKTGKGVAKKPPLTHFLCLPLVTDTSRPQLQQGLDKFKEDLASDGQVPTKAVRPTGTLHLTLGVMSLEARELDKAKDYLQSLDLHVLLRDVTHRCIAEKAAEEGEIGENLTPAAMPDTDALTINLESLVPMQAPHRTSILYAEPQDSSQRLHSFASTLREQFTEKGFLVADTRPLRLHATIMNTIYAKPKRSSGRPKCAKLKHGLKHIKHKVSPSNQKGGDAHPNGKDDAASTAGSLDDDTPTAPPDPSTTEQGGQDPAPPTTGEGEEEEEKEKEKEEEKEGHDPHGKSWMRFDARNLMDKYKGFVWADNVQVDRVYICKMGAKKIWSRGRQGEEGELLDERYEVVAEKGIFE